MAKKKKKHESASPPFVTGGGGINYEDRVAAYVLAAMLVEQPPFDDDFGAVSRVDWQTGASGWQFDDLVVTCEGPTERRLAISCKSGRYVTSGGWPKDAVERAWNQWTRAANNPFRKTDDILAVVTGAVAQDAKDAWARLLPEALLGEPARFMDLYQKGGTSSKTARRIVESLRCPPALIYQVTDEPRQRFELIRHLRLWIMDVLALDSAAVKRATGWCRSALASGDREEASTLFKALVTLASERRPVTGTLTKRELVELLAPRFALKLAPSHEASWRSLDSHTAELLNDIYLTVNGTVIQTDAWLEFQQIATAGQLVLLEGESGSGKSALAKRLSVGRTRTFWLSASDLEHTTINAIGSQLGLAVPLLSLLDEEPSSDALLVLDGAERLTEKGRRAAAQLAAAALKAVRPWLVVVTTQEGGSDALNQEIGKQLGDTKLVRSIEVRLPDEASVQGVVATLGLRLSASASPSLLRALRNLKALDWVARASQTTELKSFPDLVEQVWSVFVGADDARARAEVLKKLGKEDAAQVVGGVPSSLLPSVDEQRVLAELIKNGLLSERRQRLFFRHDLLGDWARLLVLIESGGGAGQALEAVAGSLRWGPAIRLFAEWLLHEGETGRAQLVSLITSGPLKASSQALLEGLLRSPDCGPAVAMLLEQQSWKTPATLGGLLRAFEAAATEPAAICRRFSKSRPEGAALRAAFRTPVHELWPPVVAAMEERAQEIAQIVPVQLGSVMRRWLSDAPTAERQMFARTHLACSKLAVAAARELQARSAESGYAHTEGAQHAFEAALYAARWLPDEVAALALELVERRPQPQEVKDRVEAEQKRRVAEFEERLAKMKAAGRKPPQGSGMIGSTLRPRRDAFEDGPSARVNDEFRKAVFTVGVLVRLAIGRPKEAQEVLLACCLEDPGAEDPLYSDLSFDAQTGTVDEIGWYPPIYLRGPWLALLHHAQEQGLEAIMQLVEVGTTEWLRLNVPPPDHKRHDWIVRVTTVTLSVDGKERFFRGDHDVFGWYRGYGRAGNIVASALMALESWLYGLIDANHPVDWVLKRLLETGTSVAPLGVLAALARRNPALLNGPLRPLVSSWMILDWDRHLTVQASMPQLDLLGWKPSNDVYNQEADRWSALAHRKIDLPRLIALKLALGEREIVEACEAARTLWQADLESGLCLSVETVQRLIALLDPKNLSVKRMPNGELLLSMKGPPGLEAEDEKKGQRASAAMAAFALRKLMRKFLDSPHALSDAQAELIWNEASSLPEPAPDDDDPTATIAGARAAAAAALESHAEKWLDRLPDRRSWCESAALAAIRTIDDDEDTSHGMSLFNEHREGFAGEWAMARMAAGDTRESVRRVAAQAMTAGDYVVTGQVLAAAVRLAAKMPDEVGRLFNMAWLWAALRNLAAGAGEENAWAATIATERRIRLANAFVQKRIPSGQIRWEDLRFRAARIHERHARRWRANNPAWNAASHSAQEDPPPLPSTWEGYENHGFNWGVLEKVVDHLPYVLRPSLAPELEPLVEFDRRLLDLAVWTMVREPRQQRRRSDSIPNVLERFTLSRAAWLIAGHEDAAVALSIWRTIAPPLVLHHYWVEAFFDSWFGNSREQSDRAKQFHARWQAMIIHTDGLPAWSTAGERNWYDLIVARSALLGLHARGSKLGIEQDRPFLRGMVDRYQTWAREYGADPWRLTSFCHFLQKPGAADLRLPALGWIQDTFKSLTPYHGAAKELVAEMVGLCVVVWHEQTQAVLADTNARSALIATVQHISQLQVQEIQELKADIEARTATDGN